MDFHNIYIYLYSTISLAHARSVSALCNIDKCADDKSPGAGAEWRPNVGIGHVQGFPEEALHTAGLCSIQGKCNLECKPKVDGDDVIGEGIDDIIGDGIDDAVSNPDRCLWIGLPKVGSISKRGWRGLCTDKGLGTESCVKAELADGRPWRLTDGYGSAAGFGMLYGYEAAAAAK